MHTLIVGASYSGKSWLAKRLAKTAADAAHKILVFDPLKSGGWPAKAEKHAGAAGFIKAYWAAESCYVFIDEAKVLFDKQKLEAERMAYQGRHNGHLNFFIGQRAMSMIPPNARNQCGKVFAFKQSEDDAATLAKEYDKSLLGCTSLKKCHFIASDGFSAAKGYLDFVETPPLVKTVFNT